MRKSSTLSKNKKFLKPFLTLFIVAVFVGIIFSGNILENKEETYVQNPVDLRLSEGAHRGITQNAIIKDSRFEKIAFAEIPKSEKKNYGSGLASVWRAFKFWFTPDVKGEVAEYGTWVWTPVQYLTQNYISSILFDAEREGVNVIYLSIDSYLDIFIMPDGAAKKEKEKIFADTLENFIKQANEKNIEVDAEGGWRNWAEAGHTYKPFAIVNFVKNFNETREYKFRGFQYDIEPYLLDHYHDSEESKKIVFQNFTKLVDETTYFLKDSNLKFSVVIPDFYDKRDKTVPEFSYNNKNDSALVHVLEILEQKPKSALIIMSYRNFAEGTDGSIEVSMSEMKTLKRGRYSTQMILAQETGEILPEYLTFHNTSKNLFLTESKKLSDAFLSHPNFSGLAIHYANAFLNLR